MKTMRKAAATVLAMAVLVLTASVFTACGRIDRERVVKRIRSYAKAVSDLDSTRLQNLTDIIADKDAKRIISSMKMEGLEDKERSVKRAIASTIKYKIDEDSISKGSDGNTVVCKVTFTIVDYASVLDDDSLADSKAMIKAVNSSTRTKDYETDLELMPEDDDYIFTEGSITELAGLYSFLDEEIKIPLSASEIGGMVDRLVWSSGGEDTNINIDKLEFDLTFKGFPDADYYYKVFKDGEEVYQSRPLHTEGDTAHVVFGREHGAVMDGEYLAEGGYEIYIHLTHDDTYLISGYSYVNVKKPVPTQAPAPAGPVTTEFSYTCEFLKQSLGGDFNTVKKNMEEHYGIKLKEIERYSNADNVITEPYCEVIFDCTVNIGDIVFNKVSINYIESNNYVYSIGFHSDGAGKDTNKRNYDSSSSQLGSLYGDPFSSGSYENYEYYTFKSPDGYSFFACFADWVQDGNYTSILSAYNINDGYHTEDFKE